MLHFERVVIGDYELPGNRLSRDMYDNLPLPWEVSPPVPEFAKSDYVKHDYDRDGILTNGKTFFSGGKGPYSLCFIAPPGFRFIVLNGFQRRNSRMLSKVWERPQWSLDGEKPTPI